MDRRKRAHNILEEALKHSGIKSNEDSQLVSKTSAKKVGSANHEPVERKTKAKASKPKKKSQKRKEPIKTVSNFSSFVPIASRRITKDEDNFNPEEVFSAPDDFDDAVSGNRQIHFENLQGVNNVTENANLIPAISDATSDASQIRFAISEIDKTMPRTMDMFLIDDAALGDELGSENTDLPPIADATSGPSQVHLDTSQRDKTVPRNKDLLQISAPGPSHVYFTTLESDKTVSHSMNLPFDDDVASSTQPINFNTLQSDETDSGNINLPPINDAISGPSQMHFDTLQSNKTMPQNIDLPPIDDTISDPSQIHIDNLQSAKTVQQNSDSPLTDDVASGPSQIHFDILQNANTVPRDFDLPSNNDPAPGPSQTHFDTLQNDNPISQVFDLPSIDGPTPGPSQINLDTLQNDNTVLRDSDFPLNDNPTLGPSQTYFVTLRNENSVPRNYDLLSNDVTTPDPSHTHFDTLRCDETVPHNVELPPIVDTAPSGSGRKRKAKTSIRYVDYMSDEDFSTIFGTTEVDSDEWVGSEISDSDEERDQTKKKRVEKNEKKKQRRSSKKRCSDLGNTNIQENLNVEDENVGQRGLKNKKMNTRKERSTLKQSGKAYSRKDGKTVREKSIQPNPCKGKKCGNKCEDVTDEKRQQVFNHFWTLSSERRRDWLVGMTQREPVKRKRTSSEKRCNTFKYCITEGEGKRFVCLQFLAATLDISQKCIYYTVTNANWGSARDDLRGKCEPANKTKPVTKENVVNFIKRLPAVPSHYCRQDSNRVYLPQEYKNISNLYNVYKKHYLDAGADIVSERIFRKIFTEEFNITFHIPKKDKCLKCIQLQQANINDQNKAKEKEDHETEKEESHNRFSTHKSIHKTNPSTLCSSFDLEKVLNTPHGESMLLYYSRKIAVYNLCFYENGTRKVFCYYWDESNGKRGANEIASILHNYIKSVDERGNIKHLLLYCDCCPGQNRNRTVLAMIHFTLQECKNLQTIQINYLLTGHTYMPVDSVHAVIETNLKNTIIYAPSQWYTVFTTARKDPHPYEVERMTFENFFKWDIFGDKYFKGNLTGKISKVRIVTFKKNRPSSISIKFSMNVSAKSDEVEIQFKTKGPLMSCYRSLLPIPKAKYDDLMKLCKDKVIPAQFHQEYSNIPRANNVKDTLPESDIEDD